MKICYPEVLTVPAKIDCDDFSTFVSMDNLMAMVP